jgi:hypothetical protein
LDGFEMRSRRRPQAEAAGFRRGARYILTAAMCRRTADDDPNHPAGRYPRSGGGAASLARYVGSVEMPYYCRVRDLLPDEVAMMTQERAYTSPIWCTPAGHVEVREPAAEGSAAQV